MAVLADTSALYSLLDSDEANHVAATRAFETLLREDQLVTHNYCILELIALVHRRLGIAATRRAIEDLLPAIGIEWIDQAAHSAAISALLASGRRKTSFVDLVSFELMRRHGIGTAFAFDNDFARNGFRTVPSR